MKKFKRIGVSGKDFDVELTLKQENLVELANKYEQERLQYCLNTVVGGFTNTLEEFDPATVNAIEGPITYLAGPMEFATDKGINWRNHVTTILDSMDVMVLDPCKIEVKDTGKTVKNNIDDITKAKEEGDFDTLVKIMSEAQDRDLACIDACDFILAYLNHKVGPGGTYCEFEYARNQGIPIFAVCSGDLKDENSWILTTIIRSGGKVFVSFEEALEYIGENYKIKRN